MSNDAIQPVDEISTSKEMDDWVLEIEAQPNPGISHATRPSMDSNIEKHPSIFGKWKCWDDFEVSFIPESQKWIYIACMRHCFGLNVRAYLEYMQYKVDLAWSYYRGIDEKFRVENSKRFIEHLLVNSCYLIFAMVLLSTETDLRDHWYEIVNKSNYRAKGLTRTDIENIKHFIRENPGENQCYMLTMNYQIPWFVVEVVYTKHSNLSKLFDTPIDKIAYFFCECLYPDSLYEIVGDGTDLEDGFKHLLHIFHWSRAPDGKHKASNKNAAIAHFHIPSATELQSSQTVFTKVEDGSIDVSYSDRTICGVMQLTPWHLMHYSNKLYESLLIFEDRYTSIKKPFTSYVACMACLLKTEADVQVLRESVIIPNLSLDNKDVLCLVQDLKNLIDDHLFMTNELVILQKKVMAHHNKSAYRVIGELRKRYCPNPWITISVIAGILLFVLTFLQTLYGMLSYYNQLLR